MSAINLSAENRRWIDAFRAARGRPPRMLHVGNIANNAYNNAKLLIEAGLDCDVACCEYYHAMGCPEWEDADFDGEIRDYVRPDWSSVGLHGYERPRWFAQGSMSRCVAYLLARCQGDDAAARRLWLELGADNRTASAHAAANGDEPRSSAARALHLLAFHPDLLSRLEQEIRYRVPAGSLGGLVTPLLALPLLMAALVLRLAVLPVVLSQERRKQVLRERIGQLVRQFGAEFPDRADRLVKADLQAYNDLIDGWRRLFRYYDIVQAYATEPVIPLLAGRDYFAFEHGTLRDIPFENTPHGRSTALSYRLARHVFVTNFDCLDNARLLAGERVSLINHPYDEDHGIGDHGLGVTGWEALREALCAELDAGILFFFPTRHDWVAGTGYADKANDVFLRAFADLRRRGHRVGLVCCRWGANVRESLDLLAQLGCLASVKWVEPMNTIRFERMAMACHCVADQFKLGAFGGVMFKAMAVGAPICTYLDRERILRQYGEAPPVLNCASQDEIVAQLAPLIESPARLGELGAASRAWMKRHHGRDAVVNAQLDCYRLDGAAAH